MGVRKRSYARDHFFTNSYSLQKEKNKPQLNTLYKGLPCDQTFARLRYRANPKIWHQKIKLSDTLTLAVVVHQS
jgi:hypothetical protein